MKTISFSVSLAKNSPKGPKTLTLSPGFKLKTYEDMTPGGKSVPGGGDATLMLNFSTPSSSGKLAME